MSDAGPGDAVKRCDRCPGLIRDAGLLPGVNFLFLNENFVFGAFVACDATS